MVVNRAGRDGARIKLRELGIVLGIGRELHLVFKQRALDFIRSLRSSALARGRLTAAPRWRLIRSGFLALGPRASCRSY
jgi:hypothetical protein